MNSRVHDHAVLDALEALTPVRFEGTVWRITRAGYTATRVSSANGRWSSGGGVEVLYTSLERAGALAEIGYRLSLEPVWPSRLHHELHTLTATCDRTLVLADLASLTPFGVDIARYTSFDYAATQALAAAARFLEFDGLIVPGARHASSNLLLFRDHDAPGLITVTNTEPVDWGAWRATRVRAKATPSHPP